MEPKPKPKPPPPTEQTQRKRSNPPGPLLQWMNELLHNPPFDFVFYGFYWFVVLVVLSPCAGIGLVMLTIIKFVQWLVFGISTVDNGETMELAVVITGCDSGFGCDLAFALQKRGFVVFCGCLLESSLQQFQDFDRMHAFVMDVTKQVQVDEVAQSVETWLHASSETKRVLHAVVNNAGIGHAGLIDWLDVDAFEQDMNVNYFGMIRTTKAFLPLLKAQTRMYKDARVVNVVSMAGLVVGGFAHSYHGSKFAAEALSNSLRMELRAFDIQVVTVNPSFHTSPLTESMGTVCAKVWEDLPASKKQEYGEDFFQQFWFNSVELPALSMWRAHVVEQQLLRSIELTRPPPQMIVGSDAKYAMMILRHFPVWLQHEMQSIVLKSSVKPNAMTINT